MIRIEIEVVGVDFEKAEKLLLKTLKGGCDSWTEIDGANVKQKQCCEIDVNHLTDDGSFLRSDSYSSLKKIQKQNRKEAISRGKT